MANPTVPNFNPGVGRLVTDRFDFQNHIDGTNFKHNGSSIELNPPIVITTPSDNIYDAIIQLRDAATIGIFPDATTTSKGAIQLSGDIAGTATAVSVTGIRGYPISTTPPTINYVLTWNGSSWIPASVGGSFTLGGDVTGAVGASTVVQINGKPIAATAPSTGDAIVWTGATYTPVHIIPSGTGLVTATSGAFDASATANVRYTGGKLQTDVNIQFKNSSITGDLSWTPTSSNKTLTLPNITDTLVGQTTTDTLTNKTINATNNTITDASIATGDILVSNGTKFVRQIKGSDNTFWGVSGGVVGYYALPSGIGVTGTGFAHVTSSSFDPTATANIRYSSGKFQTDVNLQFKNSSITGDLAWAPTSSNKTLTLPNATDTLVGKATTDILTNKTFDVIGTGNNLTSTSQAAGDLLKNDGTKFLRFARGSALQLLRNNSGGTDLEWISTVSVNSGSGPTITNANSGLLNNVTNTVGNLLAQMIRFTGGAQLGGLIAPADGYGSIVLAPVGNTLTIMHEDGSSTSTNRFTCPGNLNWTVADGYSAISTYDNVTTRWRLSLGLGTTA